MGFMDSIKKNSLLVQQEINDKIVAVAVNLFDGVIDDTPVAQPGTEHPGLLKNNWFAKEGADFSGETTQTFDPDGGDAHIRVGALEQSEPFLGKDGAVTMTNNLDYAVNAEYLGWPSPEWSGNIGPYMMVALNLQRVAEENR